MPISVILAAFAVAVSVPLLWWSVASSRIGTRSVDPQVLMGGQTPVDLRVAMLQRSAHARTVRPLVARMASAARQLTPAAWIDTLDRRITLAGRPPAWPIERVLFAKLALAAIAFGGGALLFADDRSPRWLIVWIGVTAMAYVAPDIVLYGRATERQQTINRSLPDTLDQMTISVEAGLGFEAAMARAGTSGDGPLADELVRTLQEIQVGVPRTTALRNLADRSDSPQLRHFVLAVIQAENYGIPIADVLRIQAAEQRVQRRQRAEEHAMKIPVKIAFPLVMCILPALFIVILGPAAIQIARTFGGTGG
jgi:tight adherence protein C